MNDLRRVSDFLNETLEFQEILDVFKRKFREFVVGAKYLDFTVAYREAGSHCDKKELPR